MIALFFVILFVLFFVFLLGVVVCFFVVHAVNSQIVEAKKNCRAYTDLANTTADAASTNDYNKLASSQQVIYLGLQKDAASLEEFGKVIE